MSFQDQNMVNKLRNETNISFNTPQMGGDINSEKIADATIYFCEKLQKTGKHYEGNAFSEEINGIQMGEIIENYLAQKSREIQFSSESVSIDQNTISPLEIIAQFVGSTNLQMNASGATAFLPDKESPYWTATIDRMSAQSGKTSGIAGSFSKPGMVQPLSPSTRSFRAATIAEGMMFTAEQLMWLRELGGANYANRGFLQYASFNLSYLTNRIITAKEYMKGQACGLGFYTYGSQVVNMGIPTQNTMNVTLGAFRGTLNSSGYYTGDMSCDYSGPLATNPNYNPYQDLITKLTLNSNMLKYQIEYVMFNSIDYQNFINQNNIQTYLTGTALTANLLQDWKKTDSNLRKMGANLSSIWAPARENIPLMCDSTMWMPQDAEGNAITDTMVPIIPIGKALVKVKLAPQNGPLGAWLNTLNPWDPLAPNSAKTGLVYNAFQAGMNTGQMMTNQTNMLTALSGSPAFFTPENMFVINLYSNITGLEELEARGEIPKIAEPTKKGK
jgi:hypothetical protein